MNGAFWRARRLGLAVAVITAILDQASKWAVLALLTVPASTASYGRKQILPILDFALTWNHGISFGLGNNAGQWNALLFSVLAVVIAGVVVYWMGRTSRTLIGIAFGLILGGAFGNIFDRLRLGAVEDFLYVHIGAFNWWPAFNVADSAICVGAGILIIDSLFTPRDSNKSKP